MVLPLAPVERLLKKTKMRISKGAAEEFAIYLEEIVADIAAEAATIAKSQGRKTVTAEDVKLARRKLK